MTKWICEYCEEYCECETDGIPKNCLEDGKVSKWRKLKKKLDK